jgi:UDP-N-acetyl-D-galactosamine dehydrogenase
MFDLDNSRIGIIGLGYVGLPLAVEFGKHFPTLGLDIDVNRVNELRNGFDSTLEVDDESLKAARQVYCTSHFELESCNIYIVTVPTPIDEHKRPDLRPLVSASRIAGKLLSLNNIVIYESTVYPGATEEVCVPILEEESGLRFSFNENFFAGYSPD